MVVIIKVLCAWRLTLPSGNITVVFYENLFQKAMFQHRFLFVLIHYIIVNKFSVMLGRFFLDRTCSKQRIKCLAQEHSTVTSPAMRLLELATLRSPV